MDGEQEVVERFVLGNQQLVADETGVRMEDTLPQPNVPPVPEQKPSVEDMAARDYKALLPKFEEKLLPMSRRQQQRVIIALLKYPLEDDRPHFSYPIERDAFYVGMQIQDCKLILMNAVLSLMKNKDQLKELNDELEKLKNEDLRKSELSKSESSIF